jgi:hypothetical protein
MRYLKLEHHNRDDDRNYAVAEGFQSCLAHCYLLSLNSRAALLPGPPFPARQKPGFLPAPTQMLLIQMVRSVMLNAR